jgi:hypothetical protein
MGEQRNRPERGGSSDLPPRLQPEVQDLSQNCAKTLSNWTR